MHIPKRTDGKLPKATERRWEPEGYDIENLPTDLPPVWKLTIELVPSTTWWDNVRSMVPKKTWDEIRKKCYADFGHRCGICKVIPKRLNCHEIWHYQDKTRTQSLHGFIALCDMCHHVKHFGYAKLLATQGKLRYNLLIEHFMRINDCTKGEFEKHETEAFAQWHQRSQRDWNVKLGEFEWLKTLAKEKTNEMNGDVKRPRRKV